MVGRSPFTSFAVCPHTSCCVKNHAGDSSAWHKYVYQRRAAWSEQVNGVLCTAADFTRDPGSSLNLDYVTNYCIYSFLWVFFFSLVMCTSLPSVCLPFSSFDSTVVCIQGRGKQEKLREDKRISRTLSPSLPASLSYWPYNCHQANARCCSHTPLLWAWFWQANYCVEFVWFEMPVLWGQVITLKGKHRMSEETWRASA